MHRIVILDLIQNLGGDTADRHSPRKRESTEQGHCTVIADSIRNPEGRGQGRQQDKPTNSPSPLMGEESKVRVTTMHSIVTIL